MEEKKYSNSYKYFENRECSYYPCHECEHINCLFCYCPMYNMSNCPGNYIINEKDGKQVKSCINCDFPHREENYDKVMAILKNNRK